MLTTLAVIEAEQLADRITVVNRDATALYDNEFVDRAWRRRPAADKAVTRGRSRAWTARETAAFHHDIARAEVRVHRDVPGEDERLAVARDAWRAAALAEPVRRITQARRRAPGVDYHRLSASEHQWVFDELIVPSYLSGIAPRDDPRAVYVMGQPGAGKLLAARMVRRAMRPGTTRLVGRPSQRRSSDPRRLPRLVHLGRAARSRPARRRPDRGRPRQRGGVPRQRTAVRGRRLPTITSSSSHARRRGSRLPGQLCRSRRPETSGRPTE
ncbi:hypothetical protein [Streptomyces caniscabiei]|uniref:hypothetical protein n=1 Tax=Streptomyces caniscabiei TaxID=2746961 RepID=UPI001F38AD52|nr:hypothetical protein [Streptomyces caniscabiei]